jgi:tellurite resistance protein
MAETLGTIIGVIVVVVILLTPVALLVTLIVWLMRRTGRKSAQVPPHARRTGNVAVPIASPPAAQVVAPGWYPDTSSGGQSRWWDGARWTILAHEHPAALASTHPTLPTGKPQSVEPLLPAAKAAHVAAESVPRTPAPTFRTRRDIRAAEREDEAQRAAQEAALGVTAGGLQANGNPVAYENYVDFSAAGAPMVRAIRAPIASVPATVRSVIASVPAVVRSALAAGTLGFVEPASSTDADSAEAQPRNEFIGGGRWIRHGETVRVAGYAIPGGLIYVGSGLRSPYGGVEPSLIDPMLDVSRHSAGRIVDQLGYWPSYASISAVSRAGYLRWLADGRREKLAPTGFMFLFMYGLERRVLVDGVDDATELRQIRDEMLRLQAAYRSSSPSFQGYSTDFIQLLELMLLQRDPASDPSPPRLSENRSSMPVAIRVQLGRLSAAGQSIPAALAFAWTWFTPALTLRTPATRCRQEYEALFEILYRENCGGGVVVPPTKRTVSLTYNPASAGIGVTKATLEGIPDVSDAVELRLPLIEIANSAQSMLDGYSRYIGKHPGTETSLEAISRLPTPLINSTLDGVSALRSWAEALSEEGLQGEASDLFRLWGHSEHTSRLTKAESVPIAQLLGELGFGVEPDVRFRGEPFSRDRPVLVFPAPVGGPRSPTAEYDAAQLLVHLAVAVSAADGHIVDVERSTLLQHIESSLGLSDDEKVRLHSHARWIATGASKLKGLPKRVAELSSEHSSGLADLLIRVAVSDGVVAKEEVDILMRIFTVLSQNPSLVASRLHTALSSTQVAVELGALDDEPITVWRAPSPVAGQSIPAKPSDPKPAVPADAQPYGLVLNRQLIDLTIQETARVSALLRDVFAEDEPSMVATPAAEVTRFGPFDSAHSELLGRLAGLSRISRTDFDEIARVLDVLPNGALDTLNEAALDMADDLLLEGDDTLFVNLDVLQEMMK